MKRVIANLDPAEVQRLLDWAGQEGWNPGLSDASAFYAADPKGFFGAFVDGIMVAGISAVAYDASFGFIGLFICHRDWRGQGHGKAVWDAAMNYLGERTIGLDGVPEQVANYAKTGFTPAYESMRMSGNLRAKQNAAALPTARFEDIAALDAKGFPVSRQGFLQHWLTSPNQGVLLREVDTVIAFAVVRPCRDGAKIGPLFARDVQAAETILASLSGPLHIDVPALQADWLQILARQGFTPGFRTTRMYRGTPPASAPDIVLGVTSLELG
ncbi:MAG: GNAT family N-acetyltransferase [Devosia sp.]